MYKFFSHIRKTQDMSILKTHGSRNKIDDNFDKQKACWMRYVFAIM